MIGAWIHVLAATGESTAGFSSLVVVERGWRAGGVKERTFWSERGLRDFKAERGEEDGLGLVAPAGKGRPPPARDEEGDEEGRGELTNGGFMPTAAAAAASWYCCGVMK